MKISKSVEARAESTQDENGKEILGEVLLTGTISYESFPYEERIKKYQETMSGLNLGADSTLDDDIELGKRYFALMKEKASVDVTLHSEDGEHKVTTVDELYEYAEGIAVANSVAIQIISAKKLGKKKLN